MSCLNNVISGCILVTHGASQRCRKSRASQSCPRFTAAIRFFAGCSRPDGSRLLRFPTSSLPISSTSRTIETGCSNHGCQNCIHREAFGSIGRTSAFIRQQKRIIAQRHCKSCGGGVSSAEEEAWVNDHQVGATRFSWNIDLIVCYRQSWNRSTDSWYPISDGQSIRQQ